MSLSSIEEYQQHLHTKYQQTLEEFGPFGIDSIEVFASPHEHHRMRTEFKAWHQHDEVFYAMFRADKSRQVYTVDYFAPGSEKIQQLMPAVRKAINENPLLKHKLFQIEFLTTSVGDALVTLIYHRPLQETWQQAAKAVAEELQIAIVGRSRNQKHVIARDFVIEEFRVAEKTFRYQQLEGAFTQPNAKICSDMLNWAAHHSSSWGGDLLELYCGNGNFTLPLAQNFDKVLATEVAKSSIQSALYNCHLNGVNNIAFVRMSSEDITGAFNGIRSYERLKHIDLNDYKFTTVFVDPPRSGLDAATNQFIQRFDNIIYISCNPTTLRGNLHLLKNSHSIQRMALFDQFPFTEHRECGVILQKR